MRYLLAFTPETLFDLDFYLRRSTHCNVGIAFGIVYFVINLRKYI